MQDHVIASFGPGGEVARCSEGAFIRLRDGRILFVYSQFRHSFHDNAASDLVACYSSDEGETFSEPELFLPASLYGVRNVMSVSLMRMENGDLGLFYLVKHPEDGTNSYHLSRSRDEGKTFYKHVPVSLPDRRAFLVVNNDRVVRLSTGRILVPIAFHRSGVNTEG
ncbi:MAG: exo-alpha-sialidase, partial [Clostridiales bacterium]|nr:exo-alpha-sialidase [Clostridiales bacterium]